MCIKSLVQYVAQLKRSINGLLLFVATVVTVPDSKGLNSNGGKLTRITSLHNF